METLAYLHHACANEAPDELPTLPASSFLSGLKPSGAAYPKILSVILGLIILGTASAAMALQRGDRGPEVASLQRQLTTVGCYSGPITEFFGSLTEQGVIECQRRFGLRQDGIAGPTTLNAINRAGGPSDPSANGVLRLGSRGQAVSDVQARLSQLGFYNGSIDGFFGSNTEAAVIRFQRDRGLVADGIVGSAVYRQLGVASVPNNPGNGGGLRPGSQGAAVEQLQQRLRNLGYFNTGVTGFYGSVTEDAVARFQRDNGIPATGIADGRTLSQLNLSGNIGSDSYYSPNRYLVIIPRQSNATLEQVRRFAPGAFQAPSRLGDYIQAGAYPTVESANEQSGILRARGLDARVTYVGN